MLKSQKNQIKLLDPGMKFGNYNYKKYLTGDIKKAMLIGLLATLFIGFFSTIWVYSFLVGVFICSVYIIKSLRWHRYYVTEIDFLSENVYIKYLEKGIEKSLSVKKKAFNAKKKTTISNARICYLILSDKQGLEIRQYEIGKWDESKMDEVLEATNLFRLAQGVL